MNETTPSLFDAAVRAVEMGRTIRLENRTPHEVAVLDSNDIVVRRLPSLGAARAEVARVVIGSMPIQRRDDDGPVYMAPVSRSTFGPVAGLPEPAPDVLHVVSRITAERAAAEGRSTDDLLIPDDVVLGPDGQPIGCRGFARL